MFFEKLYADSILPTIGTKSSAGHDLYCYDDEVLIPPKETKMINTGVKFSEVFNDLYVDIVKINSGISFVPLGKIDIQIEPRSGLAAKNDLDAEIPEDLKRMAGICDQDYNKEIKVLIHNLNPSIAHTFKKGDKIAQMVFYVGVVDLSLINNVERDGGFGSTDGH